MLGESGFAGISCDPCGVQLVVVELPVEDVGLCLLRLRVRAVAPFELEDGGYPVLPHELRHAVLPAALANFSQVEEDSGATVGAVALVPEVSNLLDQPFVFLSSP